MESQEIAKNPAVAKLQAWDKTAVAEVIEFRGETTVVVPGNRIQAVSEFLAGDPALQFTYLADLTTVDRFPIEPRYELNYQLLSIQKSLQLRLRVKLTGGQRAMAREQIHKARFAKFLAIGIFGFGDAVGVKGEAVAGC